MCIYFAACCKLAIDRLVYTSTFNVIFGGQVIENGDESMPYLPLDKVIVILIFINVLILFSSSSANFRLGQVMS